MTATASLSPTLEALFAQLADSPDDDALKLVIADALDEEGMCGAAMRWAVENKKSPLDNTPRFRDDFFWTCVEYGMELRQKHWLPHKFADGWIDDPEFPPGHQKGLVTAWTWFVNRFAHLREEGLV